MKHPKELSLYQMRTTLNGIDSWGTVTAYVYPNGLAISRFSDRYKVFANGYVVAEHKHISKARIIVEQLTERLPDQNWANADVNVIIRSVPPILQAIHFLIYPKRGT